MTEQDSIALTRCHIPDSDSPIRATTNDLVSLRVKLDIDRPILMSVKFANAGARLKMPIVDNMVDTATGNIATIGAETKAETMNPITEGLETDPFLQVPDFECAIVTRTR